MNNLSKEQIFKNVEKLVENNELKTKEELSEYLSGLKNRGILTQGQANELNEELSKLYANQRNESSHSSRMATRTPQRNDYNNGESAGFSQMGFLVINLLTLILAVAMINLLAK